VDGSSEDTTHDDASTVDRGDNEVLIEQNTRVAFQYQGSEGGSHFLDDIRMSDTTSVLIDEGFEGGVIPDDWTLRVRQPFYTWEAHHGPSEAHTGDYSAKVTWYENQDEWLVTPPILGDGSYTLTFWNKGFVGFADSATLHVHFTCDDGFRWERLYTFPEPDETEDMVWYENEVEFECPAAE
jgi:hypothetical protein